MHAQSDTRGSREQSIPDRQLSSYLDYTHLMAINQISFGDRVRIRSTKLTETLGIAGQVGIVSGRTIPSVTGVEVIGTATKDLAIAVTLEAQTRQLWFAEEVLDFVDRGAGTIVEIQGRKVIRDEHDSWREVKLN